MDNSGAIDKVEMVKVMEAIYSMVDGNMKVETTNAMYHDQSQFASYGPLKFDCANNYNCRRRGGEEQRRKLAGMRSGFSR